MKNCSKCGKEKPLDKFFKSKSTKDGYRSQCKDCHQEYQKNNPDTLWRYSLKFFYGITEDNYNKMFNDQNGCCKGCGIHQSNLEKRLCVDHDHETMLVRGLLCQQCNTILGLAKDKQQILENLIEYLKINQRSN